jgi:WD40 repeat protein/serine/threonine protein kinase
MSSCFSDTELNRYLDGELTDSRMEEIASHLPVCELCRQRLEHLTSSAGTADSRVFELIRSLEPDQQPSAPNLTFLEHLKSTPPAEMEQPGSPDQEVTQIVEAPERRNQETTSLSQSVPGYAILKELGRGGMGVVYAARQLSLNRLVALKMIVSGQHAGPTGLARFRAEAEVIASLHHPNIVQIHDIGEQDGQPFYSMELMEGGALADWLKGAPLHARPAAGLVAILAEAVQAAHQAGIIHRDLKPSNILLTTKRQGYRILGDSETTIPETAGPTDYCPLPFGLAAGDVKITDFGLARRLDGGAAITKTGLVMGTPSYLAPEMASGQHKKAGPACDVYGLGAILYECLTGRPPFRGETPTDTIMLVLHQEPVPPSRLQPRVPGELETICLKCLEKEPVRRYGSSQGLADDLRRFLRGDPIRARPTPVWQRAWKWTKRRPALAGFLALCLFIAAIGFPGVTILWYQAVRARDAEAELRVQADTLRVRADQARLAEAEQHERAEAALFAGRISLADHAFTSNDVASAEALLAKCEPEPGQIDRRGWEWAYLRRLCNADLLPGLGHPDLKDAFVHAVAFFPDGNRFVSVAGLPFGITTGWPEGSNLKVPGELKVWDAGSGACLATRRGHPGAVWDAAVSADGRFLASVSADGSVRLRDASTLNLQPGPPASDGHAYRLAFSPDNQFLAISSQQSLRVWELPARKIHWNFPSSGHLSRLAFSRDSHFLALGSLWANEIIIYDVRTGKQSQPPLPVAKTRDLVFSPDGRFLVVAGAQNSAIEVWELASRKLVRRLVGHANEVQCLAFRADGILASGSDDQTVRLWDLAAGKELMILRGHTFGVTSLAFSPDGRRLVSGSKDRRIKVWDTTRDPRGVHFLSGVGGEHLGHLSYTSAARLLTVQPADGDHHVIAERDPLEAKLLGKHRFPFKYIELKPQWQFAFDSGGRRLAAVDRTDPTRVTVRDTATAAEVNVLRTGGSGVTALALSPDGRRVAFGSFAKNAGKDRTPPAAQLQVADVAGTAAPVPIVLPPGECAGRLTFSPDGRLLAGFTSTLTVNDQGDVALSPRGALRLWDAASGQEISAIEGSVPDRVACLTFSPDGRRLAAAAMDGTLSVWSLADRQLCFPPLHTPNSLTWVTFSPDGRRLAASGMDNLVRLWDAASGNSLLVLGGLGIPGSGHYGFTARVAFSPDGTHLASNDWAGSITIWDAGPLPTVVANRSPLRPATSPAGAAKP